MGIIYRRLVFEINRLQEIVRENNLEIHWIDELESIKKAIPGSETVKKRSFFAKKAIQPDDMEFFSVQKQKYIDTHQGVCEDIGKKLLTTEHKDIVENRDRISFLENLEDNIACPGKYIHIETIMPILDLSNARALLRQYMDVLENTSLYFEEKRGFEKTIYKQLVYEPDKIVDTINKEIGDQQNYLKTRCSLLTDIESEYRKKAAECYGEFVGLTVLKEIADYANSQVIWPWNQAYGHETIFSKRVRLEEISIPFAGDIAADVKSRTMPVMLVQNPEWIKYSENYIICVENSFREVFTEDTKAYINKCVSLCLKEELETIGRKKHELIKRESELKEQIIHLKELQSQLKTQEQELEDYYSSIKIKPVKVKKNHSDDPGAVKDFRRLKGSLMFAFAVVMVLGVIYGSKKNRSSAVDDIEQSIDSTDYINIAENISETPNIAGTEPIEETEPIEKTENVPETENIAETEKIETTESIADVGITENTEIEELEESAEITESTETIESIEVTEKTESSAETENEEEPFYILPESSTKYLTEGELDGLDGETLRLARNEIFARHGRLFQTEDLNEYFSELPWYHGYLSEEEFDASVLNDYERANLDLIKSVEHDLAVAKEKAVLGFHGQDNGSQGYILPESSSRYLSMEDLDGLDEKALRLARNEIFARHGRLFQTEDLNEYFSNQPWYYGYLSLEEFDDSVLNHYERTNLDLIQSIERQQNDSEITYESFDIDWYERYKEIVYQTQQLYENVFTQQDYTNQRKKEYEIWDALLNELYQYTKELYASFSDDSFEDIRKEEFDWIRERDQKAERATNRVVSEYKEEAYYGSMIESTKNRIIQIIERYILAY